MAFWYTDTPVIVPAVEIPPISLFTFRIVRVLPSSLPFSDRDVVETLVVGPLRENGDSLCQIAGIPEWRVISRLEIGTRETSWRDNIIVEHDGLRIL